MSTPHRHTPTDPDATSAAPESPAHGSCCGAGAAQAPAFVAQPFTPAATAQAPEGRCGEGKCG